MVPDKDTHHHTRAFFGKESGHTAPAHSIARRQLVSERSVQRYPQPTEKTSPLLGWQENRSVMPNRDLSVSLYSDGSFCPYASSQRKMPSKLCVIGRLKSVEHAAFQEQNKTQCKAVCPHIYKSKFDIHYGSSKSSANFTHSSRFYRDTPTLLSNTTQMSKESTKQSPIRENECFSYYNSVNNYSFSVERLMEPRKQEWSSGRTDISFEASSNMENHENIPLAVFNDLEDDSHSLSTLPDIEEFSEDFTGDTEIGDEACIYSNPEREGNECGSLIQCPNIAEGSWSISNEFRNSHRNSVVEARFQRPKSFETGQPTSPELLKKRPWHDQATERLEHRTKRRASTDYFSRGQKAFPNIPQPKRRPLGVLKA